MQRLDDMQQAIVRLQRPIRDIEFRRTQEDDNVRNEKINALVRNGIDNQHCGNHHHISQRKGRITAV